MQQPPPGQPRPPGPYYPQQGGQRPHPGAAAGQYQPPPPGYAPAPAPAVAPPARKPSRGALRFVASTCVFSAWLTLVLSVLGALFSFSTALTAGSTIRALMPAPSPPPLASPAPSTGGENADGSTPIPGLDALTGGQSKGGLPGGEMLGFLTPLVAPVLLATGVFTLVTGVVGWVILLGMGQACYVLMDLEEQSYRHSEVLQILVARLGGAR